MIRAQDGDEPLECSIAISQGRIPHDVRHRLEARARAGHFVTADGLPDLGALLDERLLEAGDGHLTCNGIHAVITDAADRDLGVLARVIMTHILLRDGYPEIAAMTEQLGAA